MVWMASAATDFGIDTANTATDYLTFDREDALVFQPVTPCRLLDTRSASQEGVRRGAIGPTLPFSSNNQLTNNDITVVFDPDADNVLTAASHTVTQKRLMGKCDPTSGSGTVITSGHDPVAVVLNVTAVSPSADSFITVYPWVSMLGDDETADTAARPFVSHLNPARSEPPTPNAVTVKLDNTANPTSIGGASFTTQYKAFRLYNNQGTVNVIVDVVGYYYSQQVVQNVTGS
jgi:hypothetical protein